MVQGTTIPPRGHKQKNYAATYRVLQGTQARRTDIEVLCEIIFAHGERYEDGTAAIGFTWLFKVSINHFFRF